MFTKGGFYTHELTGAPRPLSQEGKAAAVSLPITQMGKMGTHTPARPFAQCRAGLLEAVQAPDWSLIDAVLPGPVTLDMASNLSVSVSSPAGWASWYLPHGAVATHPILHGMGHMGRAQQVGAEVTFPSVPPAQSTQQAQSRRSADVQWLKGRPMACTLESSGCPRVLYKARRPRGFIVSRVLPPPHSDSQA